METLSRSDSPPPVDSTPLADTLHRLDARQVQHRLATGPWPCGEADDAEDPVCCAWLRGTEGSRPPLDWWLELEPHLP